MAGLIPPDKLEQIRSASDIVDVIGSYLPLKRAGGNFVALCPFHKEKSPSFNVNPQRQIFHCFGCHKGGDVFTFVREYESLPFMDAVRRLAERAKIPLEFENDPSQGRSRQLKDQLLHLHEQITQRWQNCLANEAAGHAARDYLAQRGVPPEAVQLFRLGAAPEVWDDTVNWAKSKGHDLALVEQAGLILRKEGGDHHYDRFRGRLMFPICDEQGRVIGFSGRVLSADQKTATYVNSPETPIFTKGKVFFGLDKSKRALLDAQTAIVCEGQLDLIACFMADVKNIVAPQGTALTADHARILKRYVEEVVLCFDADTAGQNATVRSLDSLLAAGLAVRVAVVPAPHDPDSFIKAAGGPAFREVIARAEGFFDYYLNRLVATHDLGTDRGRLGVLHAMAEAVHKTGNGVLIDTYAQKTALRLAVSPESVRLEFRKFARTKPSAPAADEPPPESDYDLPVPEVEAEVWTTPSEPEIWLLKVVFAHEDTLEWLVAHLDLSWIAHAGVRHILDLRLNRHRENTWRGVGALLEDIESEPARRLITELTTHPRPIPNPTQQASLITLRLRNQFFDRRKSALLQQTTDPALDDTARHALLHQMEAVRQAKLQPLTPLPGVEDEPF